MLIAAIVSGARQGFIYIRHEYEEQIERLEEAIEEAKRLGALGKNIFQSGRSFDLEVFVSPGGYVCGEQTALIEALEGKRSEPRNRPPELQTNGLYDQPTILNNVETFAWVPSILLREANGVCWWDEGRGWIVSSRIEWSFGGLFTSDVARAVDSASKEVRCAGWGDIGVEISDVGWGSDGH